jgi:hypothetical protein
VFHVYLSIVIDIISFENMTILCVIECCVLSTMPRVSVYFWLVIVFTRDMVNKETRGLGGLEFHSMFTRDVGDKGRD